MAMSGVKLHEDVMECHQLQKMKSLGKANKIDYKYITYKLSDAMDQIMPDYKHESTNDQEADWNHLLDQLTDASPRYIVFDLHYTIGDRKKDDLLFINWCSDNAPTKPKMVAAASKETLTKALKINDKRFTIQAADKSDLELASIIADLSKQGFRFGRQY